mmetsp:Transcript_11897/g.17031  ORF Transcript_11897/g.17031 Transcript_11897/m.17031 type:complete len:382 (-) Transcript_11897:332-1477(-)
MRIMRRSQTHKKEFLMNHNTDGTENFHASRRNHNTNSAMTNTSARRVRPSRSVAALEERVIEHLKKDEFSEALKLYEQIIDSYTTTFKKRKELNAADGLNMSPFIGNALYNLGIIHFLDGNFAEALSYLEQSAENREAFNGVGHPDHLASLIKTALCYYAIEDFGKAHTLLESALALGESSCQQIEDLMQIAEVLNNLGCLSFMCGEPVEANRLFQRSLELQHSVLSDSIYGGSEMASPSTTLCYSVTRGNSAFLKMCSRDNHAAIVSFEAALMSQQMLLHDAHETMIATMDHLAVANLLCGRKQKALDLMKRMLRAQVEAYGEADPRCAATVTKIGMVREKEDRIQGAVNQISKAHAVREKGGGGGGKSDSRRNLKGLIR